MLKSFDEFKKKVAGRGLFISRTKLGFCKNEGCNNKRRERSAYCQECSDKHNNKLI